MNHKWMLVPNQPENTKHQWCSRCGCLHTVTKDVHWWWKPTLSPKSLGQGTEPSCRVDRDELLEILESNSLKES